MRDTLQKCVEYLYIYLYRHMYLRELPTLFSPQGKQEAVGSEGKESCMQWCAVHAFRPLASFFLPLAAS